MLGNGYSKSFANCLRNKSMRKLIRRLVYWIRQKQLESELAEEMEYHRARRMEHILGSGSTPEEAAAASHRAMGNTTLSREESRGVWIWPWLEQLLQDSHYAFLSVVRKPLLALLSVAILSATIGLVCSAFAVLDAVVLRKLPVPHPEELVFLIGNEGQPFRAVVLDELGRNRESISNMFGFIPLDLNATVKGVTIPLSANVIRGDYFGTMGTVPQLGRFLGPKEQGDVAVISDRFWRREFAASPDVIGQSLRLGTTNVTIIGVTQPGFYGIEPTGYPDVTLPGEAYNHARGSSDFDYTSPLYGVARLRPGVTVDRYKAQLNTLWPAILEATIAPAMTPDAWRSANGTGVQVFSVSRGLNFATMIYPHIPRAIQMIFWLSVLIFSTGCLTLALLAVARSVRNQHQTAVRLAIGGSRRRLLRPFLIESAILSAIGCIGGLMIAFWWSRIAAYLMPDSNILDWHVYVNAKVILLGISLAVLIAVLSTFIASLVISRVSLSRILHDGNTVSSTSLRLRMGLLTVQLAMSVLLLHYALFYVGEFLKLSRVPAGFDVENLHIYRLSTKPPERKLQDSYFQDLLSQINRLPGVESAAITLRIPPFYDGRDPSHPVTTDDRRNSKAALLSVLPGYFHTLRLPLLSGRHFTQHDRNTAVITSALAEKLYAGENPLNHTIRGSESNTPYTIVGVVGNIAYFGQGKGSSVIAFTCCDAPASSETRFFMIVRSKRTLADLGRDIRTRVERLGLHYVSTMAYQKDHLNWSRQSELLLAAVSGTFGILMLFMVGTGLFAFCNYIFTFRNKELAIRASLGAAAPKLAAALLREIAKVLVFGLAIGLAAIIITQKVLSSRILNINPLDLQNMIVSTGIIVCITGCAVLVPTLKAIRMNVFEALRIE
jgi:putative ABC transport system permease protein